MEAGREFVTTEGGLNAKTIMQLFYSYEDNFGKGYYPGRRISWHHRCKYDFVIYPF